MVALSGWDVVGWVAVFTAVAVLLGIAGRKLYRWWHA